MSKEFLDSVKNIDINEYLNQGVQASTQKELLDVFLIDQGVNETNLKLLLMEFPDLTESDFQHYNLIKILKTVSPRVLLYFLKKDEPYIDVFLNICYCNTLEIVNDDNLELYNKYFFDLDTYLFSSLGLGVFFDEKYIEKAEILLENGSFGGFIRGRKGKLELDGVLYFIDSLPKETLKSFFNIVGSYDLHDLILDLDSYSLLNKLCENTIVVDKFDQLFSKFRRLNSEFIFKSWFEIDIKKIFDLIEGDYSVVERIDYLLQNFKDIFGDKKDIENIFKSYRTNLPKNSFIKRLPNMLFDFIIGGSIDKFEYMKSYYEENEMSFSHIEKYGFVFDVKRDVFDYVSSKFDSMNSYDYRVIWNVLINGNVDNIEYLDQKGYLDNVKKLKEYETFIVSDDLDFIKQIEYIDKESFNSVELLDIHGLIVGTQAKKLLPIYLKYFKLESLIEVGTMKTQLLGGSVNVNRLDNLLSSIVDLDDDMLDSAYFRAIMFYGSFSYSRFGSDFSDGDFPNVQLKDFLDAVEKGEIMNDLRKYANGDLKNLLKNLYVYVFSEIRKGKVCFEDQLSFFDQIVRYATNYGICEEAPGSFKEAIIQKEGLIVEDTIAQKTYFVKIKEEEKTVLNLTDGSFGCFGDYTMSEFFDLKYYLRGDFGSDEEDKLKEKVNKIDEDTVNGFDADLYDGFVRLKSSRELKFFPIINFEWKDELPDLINYVKSNIFTGN